MRKKPKRVEDIPVYREAYDRLQELQNRKKQVDCECAEAEVSCRTVDVGQIAIQREATALLSGEPYDGPRPEDLQQRVADLQHERRVLTVAIPDQERVVDKARSEASRLICEANEPEYRVIIEDMSEAVSKLLDFAKRERDFREEITRVGAASFVDPLKIACLGNADQTEHILKAWLEEHANRKEN